ncbi:MAG: DMT family transporter [Kiloniellaceae bacterium]
MERLSEHAKGLVITTVGVLVLTPDSLLVRLIALDSWTMVFWRGVLLMLALSGFLAAYYRGEAPARFRAVGATGLAAAAVFAAGSVLFIVALHHTSVANTLVIIAAAPLIAAVFSRLFLAEPVPVRTWAAILAAIVGIGVLASDSARGGTLGGDLAALGTAVCMAAGLTLIRRARARNMVPAMALSGALSALAMLPLASPLTVQAEQVGLLLLLGLFVLPVAFALVTLGPRYLPAPEVGLILLLETVLGPLWVWLALGETPSARALIGGAIVIAALIAHSALALRHSRRQSDAEVRRKEYSPRRREGAKGAAGSK